jgi:hypothetical protein
MICRDADGSAFDLDKTVCNSKMTCRDADRIAFDLNKTVCDLKMTFP